MPTHQRRAALKSTLEALGRVNYPADRLQLIVVCDGCADGSARMARCLRLPFEVRVLEQANQGPAAARNLALRQAEGTFVLFLDDDVLPTPDLVAEHASAHARRDEDRVVIGTLLSPGQGRTPWINWELLTVEKQYIAMAAGEYEPTPRQFYTGNASVRLEHVTAVGGFDTSFKRGEDVELAFRLEDRGLRFVFWPRAAGVHVADRPFRSWLAAAHQYGANDVLLGQRGGRPDLLDAVAAEFWGRHPVTQRMVRATFRAGWIGRVLAGPGMVLAWLAQWLRLKRFSYAICSLLFNLAYWHGVQDEIGGPMQARRLIEAAGPSRAG